MSYLLLTNIDVCPSCHYKTRPSHFSHCRTCNTLIFHHPIDFISFEADGGFRQYYLWTKDRGWIHRDHVMMERAKAMEREENIIIPERNVGTTPEQVAKRGGKLKIRRSA